MIKTRSIYIAMALGAVATLPACSNWMGDSGRSGTRAGGTGVSTPALSDDMVRQVQSSLRRDGFYTSGNIDGVWGSGTESGVMAFQRDRNLTPSGRLDAATLHAMNLVGPGSVGATGSGLSGQTASRGDGMEMPSRDMVRRAQSTLRRDGYYNTGSIDGVWGSGTESAVIAYQRDRNLNVTGRLDAPTLQAMNLATGADRGDRNMNRPANIDNRPVGSPPIVSTPAR